MTKEKKQNLFIYANLIIIMAILLFYLGRGLYYYNLLEGNA